MATPFSLAFSSGVTSGLILARWFLMTCCRVADGLANRAGFGDIIEDRMSTKNKRAQPKPKSAKRPDIIKQIEERAMAIHLGKSGMGKIIASDRARPKLYKNAMDWPIER